MHAHTLYIYVEASSIVMQLSLKELNKKLESPELSRSFSTFTFFEDDQMLIWRKLCSVVLYYKELKKKMLKECQFICGGQL